MAIRVTEFTCIVGARKLQLQLTPVQQNTVPWQGSLQRVGNALRQTPEINRSPRDLNAEPIPIADPIRP